MVSREDVEEIRRRIEDPHQPIEDDQFTLMDAHFLKEQIQNAENNEYPEEVDPSLEFVITSKDITKTGAPAALLVFNNEKGFSRADIESICGGAELATNKGLRSGFKSVFLVTDQPYIFSNGYLIRFTKEHCHQCNISHIVPEWVEEDAMLSAIVNVYGSDTPLPTTTLVLPLKPKKVRPVKDQLSSIHPEVLLFLSKIKRLSVREDNEHSTVSRMSVSSDKQFRSRRSDDDGGVSYPVFLTADDVEYGYRMWEQRFAVNPDNRVDVRREVEEWVITLAFPIGEERLKRPGLSSPGIYSFLPTATVTNFPFIIQADFILASSRENNILWDNIWNQGILDCVPEAFFNAFTTMISTKNPLVLNHIRMFRFLPVNKSCNRQLNNVRDGIRSRLLNQSIIPREPDSKPFLLCKPMEVASRLDPSFLSILESAGVRFPDTPSQGAYFLPRWLDTEKYKDILDFLEIRHDCEWYARSIRNYNLVMGVSEEVYIQLLVFIVEHWGSWSYQNPMKDIPLIKYVGLDGNIGLLDLNSSQGKLLAADLKLKSDRIPWMIDWNIEFRSPNVPGIREFGRSNGNREFVFSIGRAFLPEGTEKDIRSSGFKRPMLVKWLEKVVGVKFVSIEKYAEFLSSSVKYDRKLVVTYACFLYTSFINNNFFIESEVKNLCSKMPILDKHGNVNVRISTAFVPSNAHTSKNPKNIYTDSDSRHKPNTAPNRSREVIGSGVILIPATGSRWVQLCGMDLWRHENYVELGEDYTRAFSYFRGDKRILIPEGELLSFLETHGGASDVLHLSPPDAPIPTLSDTLTKRNTFLLLDWIRNLKKLNANLPERFLSSIKRNSWLKVSVNGKSGYHMPSESFMLDSKIGEFLQDESLPFSIPLVDEKFYGVVKIRGYKEELRRIGVRTEGTEAGEYIGKLLMSLAASSGLTEDQSLWILKFTKFLQEIRILSAKFIDIVKQGKWVRTSQGYMTPSSSVVFSPEWVAASLQITDIPFIDHYGEEILISFKKQLAQLGVIVNFNESHQLVLDYLRSSDNPDSLNSLTSEAMFLLLTGIKSLESSDKRVQAIRNTKCLKTNFGYECPSKCLMSTDPDWSLLLNVFGSYPFIYKNFYGSFIFNMPNELQKIGVIVDFEDATKEFIRIFKQHASISSITASQTFSFLQSYRWLKRQGLNFPDEFKNCICHEKWIRTRLGDYSSPNDCILFSKEWEQISSVSMLPFIDDSNDFYGSAIYSYREELKEFGVVTDFEDGARFVSA